MPQYRTNLHLFAKTTGAILLGIILIGQAAATDLNGSDIDQLDKLYQNFSKQFYLQKSTQTSTRHNNFQPLMQAVEKHQQNKQTIDAITLIVTHLDLIQSNVDSPAVINILALLLKHNEWDSASRLFTTIQNDSNKTIVSNARFIMAKHYMRRNQWQKAIEQLDGITGDLVVNDADYANLMHGVALQRLKKHREAIEIYEKNTAISTLHPQITLNLAVAYIRQDWWTDAHAAINELLKRSLNDSLSELENRFNVILGYSLMRQGYYRNARDAFRKVNISSQYTNQALIGITLAAINQDNYVGALNAATILKEKQEHDLPSAESYLLIPYIYSKLDQSLTASASYSSAIEHYTQEIQAIETLLEKNSMLLNTIQITDNQILMIDKYQMDTLQRFPQSLIDNYLHIKEFKIQTDIGLTQQLNPLEAAYNDALINVARAFLTERATQLNSYIAQSRYGLALLYDSSLTE